MKGSRGHYLVSLARKNYDQVHDCPSVKNIENENVKQPFPIDDNSHQEVVDRPTTCGYGKRITEDDTAIPTIKKAKSNISLPDLESEKENNQALINPTEVSNSSQQKTIPLSLVLTKRSRSKTEAYQVPRLLRARHVHLVVAQVILP